MAFGLTCSAISSFIMRRRLLGWGAKGKLLVEGDLADIMTFGLKTDEFVWDKQHNLVRLRCFIQLAPQRKTVHLNDR